MSGVSYRGADGKRLGQVVRGWDGDGDRCWADSDEVGDSHRQYQHTASNNYLGWVLLVVRAKTILAKVLL